MLRIAYTMKKQEKDVLKKEFLRLYLTGKYNQKEIAVKLSISEQTAVYWMKHIPSIQYVRIRANLIKELERLSKKPEGNEDLIFKYITHLEKLDLMIRKAKYLPNLTEN